MAQGFDFESWEAFKHGTDADAFWHAGIIVAAVAASDDGRQRILVEPVGRTEAGEALGALVAWVNVEHDLRAGRANAHVAAFIGATLDNLLGLVFLLGPSAMDRSL